MNKFLLTVTLVALFAVASAHHTRGRRDRLNNQVGGRCRRGGCDYEGGYGEYEGQEFGGYEGEFRGQGRGSYRGGRRGGRVQGGAFGAERERRGSIRGDLRAGSNQDFELERRNSVGAGNQFELEGDDTQFNNVQSLNSNNVVDNSKTVVSETNRGSSSTNGFSASSGSHRGGRLGSSSGFGAESDEGLRSSNNQFLEAGGAASGESVDRVGAIGGSAVV